MIREFIALILILLLCSCVNEQTSLDYVDPEMEESMKFELASDVELLYSDSARLKARITGPVLKRYVSSDNPYDEFVDGIDAEFFDKKGNLESRLVADYAIRYERTKEVIARDDSGAILSSLKGDTLISTELIWNEKEDRIYTNRAVLIKRPDRVIWGQGFESNQDFTKGRIKAIQGEMDAKDFKSSFSKPKEKPVD